MSLCMPLHWRTPHGVKQTADEGLLTILSAGGKVKAVLLASTAVSLAQGAPLCVSFTVVVVSWQEW